MAVAVVLGNKIQKKTLFVYPLDILTLAIATLLVCNLFVFRIVNLEFGLHIPIIPIPVTTGYLPFGLGYFLGYVLGGARITTHVMVFNGTWILNWFVFYQRPNDNRLYLAEQTNIGLLKRVFLGIHHEVKTNDNTVFIGREQPSTARYPWWPRHNTELIWVLDWVPVAEVQRRFLSPVKWTSEVTLAWGSMAEVWQVMQSVETLARLNDIVARQQRQIASYEEKLTALVAEQIGVILAVMRKGNPINYFLELHEQEDKKKEKKENQEVAENEDETDI